MKNLFYLISFFINPIYSHPQTVLTSVAEEKSQNNQSNICQRNHLEFLQSEENSLSFTNAELQIQEGKKIKRDKSSKRSGIFGIGFCWWHSRLTLNAAYLASFEDSGGDEIITNEDAEKVIMKLIEGNVVKIKNFKNLYSFSKKFEQVIKQELNRWQVRDTLKGRWVNGLRGKPTMEHSKLYIKIEKLYEKFITEKKPIFQILQISGLDAHSWIIVNITKNDEEFNQSFEILALDSLYPFPLTATVKKNDSASNYLRYDDKNFIPNVSHPEYSNRIGYFSTIKHFIPQDVPFANKEEMNVIKSVKEYCESNHYYKY